MIEPYWGEFLVSPIPLELSLNYCSHKCNSVHQPMLRGDLQAVAAGEIQVGDEVLGFDRRPTSRYREWQRATVEAVEHRMADAYRFYLADGQYVDCTPDHGWYTGRAGAIEYASIMTKTGKIREGKQLIQLDLPMLPNRPFTHDYMLGYVRALIAGEASTTPYGAYRLAMQDPEPLARAAQFLILLGLGEFDVRPNPHLGDRMSQIYLPVRSAAVPAMNGSDIDSNDYRRGWLAGIYDAEGHNGTSLRIFQYPNKNPDIYQQIGSYLSMSGFAATAEPKGWRLQGSHTDTARFAQWSQPAIRRKQNPLEGWITKFSTHRSDVVAFEPLGKIEVASIKTSTGNYVSNGYLSKNCAYCFANLNQPDRKANMQRIMRMLSEYEDRKTLPALLMQQGYPVVVSNRVDPFAHSNGPQFLPILDVMVQMGIPVQIQTKGGKQEWIDEALAMMPPSMWYISIAHLNDTIRKQIEPGAPSMQSRLDLIDLLHAKGHKVSVGINPVVPEWLPEPEPLIKELAARGVDRVWIEKLHFNYKQVAQMSPREKASLGDDLIKRVQKHRTQPSDWKAVMDTRDCAMSYGMEVFSVGQPTRSDYFSDYESTYNNKVFPTLQDFVNLCYDQNLEDTLIPFEVFRDCLMPKLPPGILPIDSYIGSVAHNAWWDGDKIPPQMSFDQLLSFIWNDHRIRQCPSRLPCFAWAAIWDTSHPAGWIQLVDENNRPYLVFDPSGFDEYYTHVEIDAIDEPMAATTA